MKKLLLIILGIGLLIFGLSQGYKPLVLADTSTFGDIDIVDTTNMSSSYYVGSWHSFSVTTSVVDEELFEFTICQEFNYMYTIDQIFYRIGDETSNRRFQLDGTQDCQTKQVPITWSMLNEDGEVELHIYGVLYLGDASTGYETLWDLNYLYTLTDIYENTEYASVYNQGYEDGVGDSNIIIDTNGDTYDDRSWNAAETFFYNSGYNDGFDAASSNDSSHWWKLPGQILGSIGQFIVTVGSIEVYGFKPIYIVTAVVAFTIFIWGLKIIKG